MIHTLEPCPACGGSIHRIAGKCKHCKVDLVPWRLARVGSNERTGASALNGAGAAPATPSPASSPRSDGDQPRDSTAEWATPPPGAVARGGWRRRWPTVAIVCALLTIGISLYLLLGETKGRTEEPTSTPRLRGNVPEPADQFNMPRGLQAPDDPGVPDDPGGFASPQRPPSAPHSPSALSTAPPPGQFGSALANLVCARLTTCGILDTSMRAACTLFSAQLSEPSVEERIASGECRYDKTAALACLRIVETIPCDMQSGDLLDILPQISALSDCAMALVCNTP